MATFKAITKKIKQRLFDFGYKDCIDYIEKKENNIFSRIYFQSSHYDKSFYINVIHGINDTPNTEKILTNYRLSNHGLPGVSDYSWSYGLEDQINSAIDNILIPWVSVFINSKNINILIDKEQTDVFSEKVFLFVTPERFLQSYNHVAKAMQQLGFDVVTQSSALLFIRKKQNFWDIIQIKFISEGVFATVEALCWCSELEVTEEDSTKTTPTDFDSIKTVNSVYIDADECHHLPQNPIFIGDLSEENVQKNTTLLLNNVKMLALPYLSKINSGQELLQTLPPEYLRSSYYEKAIKIIKYKYNTNISNEN